MDRNFERALITILFEETERKPYTCNPPLPPSLELELKKPKKPNIFKRIKNLFRKEN